MPGKGEFSFQVSDSLSDSFFQHRQWNVMRTQLFSSQWLQHLLLQQPWLRRRCLLWTVFIYFSSTCLSLSITALFLTWNASDLNSPHLLPTTLCATLSIPTSTSSYALYILCFCFSVTPPPSSTQPDELTNVLEICNIVFTSMFTLEMILKLTAFGFFEYLRNPYNIFDGIIVIIRSASISIYLYLSSITWFYWLLCLI